MMFLLMVVKALRVGPVFAVGMIFPPPPAAQCKFRNQFGDIKKDKDSKFDEEIVRLVYLED